VKYGAFFLLFLSVTGWAQQSSSVSGSIRAKGGEKISGAHVFLLPDTTSLSVSDEEGKFLLKNIATGRKIIQISAQGYQTYQEELLITASRDVMLEVVLEEESRLLEQVQVTAGSPLNTPGAYVIGIEKTIRMPANFFDPVRMTSVLPGVATTNDQTNGIAFRGYSPNALLWRLNGLDIVNPNHLSNAGTLSDRPVANGGGVSILSSQVLDKTEFQFGIPDASTGNALSGAVNLQFRKGDSQQRQRTIQAGLVGLDIAAEGPVSKNESASYLVNYRYSTVGLLTSAGLDFGGERINFNDLTFNISADTKKSGSFSVFGFAGLSANKFSALPESEREFEKDRYDIDYSGKTFGIGLKNEQPINQKVTLRTAMAFSGQIQKRNATGEPVPFANLRDQRFESERSVLSVNSSLYLKPTPGITSETGVVASGQWNNLIIRNKNTLGDFVNDWNGTVNGWLIQPYSEWNFSAGPIAFRPSLRYAHFTYNSKGSFDPRVTASMAVAGGRFSAGFGQVSQIQQTQWYLPEGNSDLPMTKSRQWYAEYLKTYTSGLSWRLQAFRHRLSDVPVVPGDLLPISALPFSTLNLQEEIVNTTLVADGTGKNEGLEAFVEKRFDNAFYFLASGSIYRSGFGVEGNDNFYSGRFDGRYTSAFAAGKEWMLRKNAFGIHVKALSFGGQKERVIDAEASASEGYTVYDPLSTYSIVLPDYYRFDLRAAWRKNKPGKTRTVSIDIQNLTNRENIGGYYFDTALQAVVQRKQLGIIPVLTWRMEF